MKSVDALVGRRLCLTLVAGYLLFLTAAADCAGDTFVSIDEPPAFSGFLQRVNDVSGEVTGDALAAAFFVPATVTARIRRDCDGKYWNGFMWTDSADQGDLPTNVDGYFFEPFPVFDDDLTRTWMVKFGVRLPPYWTDGTYTFSARAKHGLNTASVQHTVRIDGTPPELVITIPSAGAVLKQFPKLSGVARNPAGRDACGNAAAASGGPEWVDLFVIRKSDGLVLTYKREGDWPGNWNGDYEWVEPGFFVYLFAEVDPATGQWSLPLPAKVTSSEGAYEVYAITSDGAGNTVGYYDDDRRHVGFSIDSTPPALPTIDTPASGATLPGFVGISGSASDNVGGSGVQRVSVTIQRLDSGDFWNGAFWGAETRLETTVTVQQAPLGFAPPVHWALNSGLPAGDMLSDGSYRITAYAYDVAGNASVTAIPVTIQKATPHMTFGWPINGGAYNYFPSIDGTATAQGGLSVARVEVHIYQADSNRFWDGTKWGSQDVALPTILLDNNRWAHSGAEPFGADAPDGVYLLLGFVFDTAGNSKRELSYFKIDTVTPPTFTFNFPIDGQALSDFHEIRGTASDNPYGSGIDSVQLMIRRASDEAYWTGTGWGSIGEALWVKGAVSGENWAMAAGLPSRADLSEGSYWLEAMAIDRAGNGTFPLLVITNLIDYTPPTVAFDMDVLMTSLPRVVGKVEDRRGSGVARVELALERASDGSHWDGSKWTPDLARLSTTLSGAVFVRDNGLPSGADLPTGDYTITAFAYDKAGNSGIAKNYFSVDKTPPAQPSAPDLEATSDTGSSDSDNLTREELLFFSGHAEAGATMELFADDALVRSGRADQSGRWSLRLSAALPEGTHAFHARATDRAGNSSPSSATTTVIVDRTPPNVTARSVSIEEGATFVGKVATVTGERVLPQTSTTDVAATDVPLALPDTAATTSTLTVDGLPANATVADVDLTLTIAHPFDADLVISLIAPDGTPVRLAERRGLSGDNYTLTTFDDQAAQNVGDGVAPFSGSFRPEEALSTLNGKAPGGQWTLRVEDAGPGDTGTLESWSLRITASAPLASGFSASIDWGDGETSQGTISLQQDGSFAVEGVHAYDREGERTMKVTVTDASGNSASSAATATVTAKIIPLAFGSVTVSSAISEGDMVTIKGKLLGVGAQALPTLRVDWADGSPTETLQLPAGAADFELAHQYADDSPSGSASDDYTVQLTLTDNEGASVSTTATVTVNNLAPTLSDVAATSPVTLGAEVRLSGRLADAGWQDTFSLVVDWGDGAVENFSLDPGQSAFDFTHTYGAPGQKQLSLTLTDDDFGSATAGARVTVESTNADLVLRALDIPSSALVGDAFNYTFQVETRGPATATGVALRSTLASGLRLDTVSASPGHCTLASPEERFVSQLYLDLLDRPADSIALATLIETIRSGASRAQIAQSVLSSAEYRRGLIQNFYQRFLGRSVDEEGLGILLNSFQNGATDEQIIAAIVGSAEYFAAHGGTTNGFLEALFNDLLGRPIDPLGRTTLGQALASDSTRAQVAGTVLTSREYRVRLVQGYYERFLHRAADNTATDTLVNLLQNGGTDEQVIAAIVGSDEYFASTPAILTCELGTLPPGASAVVAMRVAATRVGAFTTTASLTASETDANPEDNFASVQTSVTAPVLVVPELKITRTGGAPRLSWPAAAAESFVLEASPDLSPLSWTTVTARPSRDGDHLVLTDDSSRGKRFYRLKKR
jgi:subtilisin-like proprotein convertase family protein